MPTIKIGRSNIRAQLSDYCRALLGSVGKRWIEFGKLGRRHLEPANKPHFIDFSTQIQSQTDCCSWRAIGVVATRPAQALLSPMFGIAKLVPPLITAGLVRDWSAPMMNFGFHTFVQKEWRGIPNESVPWPICWFILILRSVISKYLLFRSAASSKPWIFRQCLALPDDCESTFEMGRFLISNLGNPSF